MMIDFNALHVQHQLVPKRDRQNLMLSGCGFKEMSSNFVYFSFRLLSFRILPLRLSTPILSTHVFLMKAPF